MSRPPPEAFKQLADRIAGHLCTREGAEALSLLQQVGAFARPEPADRRGPPAPPTAPTAPTARRVGIWTERLENNESVFVRDADAADGILWAPTERIGPKISPRVVLIGESAARGFFYDPDYTPSAVLCGALRAVPGFGSAEVVDLGRTDQILEPLLGLANAALALRPDAIVAFAGNNWGPFLTMSRVDLLQTTARLREGGVAALLSPLWARLLDFARTYVDGLSQISKQSGVPVVIVIPQFNLRAWNNRAMFEQPPFLPGDGNARWQALLERADAALLAGDVAEVERLAGQMREIDRGLSPAATELLAECRLRAGRPAEANELLELARDADPDWRDRNTPRCPRLVQDFLRREAPARGLRVVDLVAEFAEKQAGGLPDPSLFLDYCHLSSAGMRVAMIATARQLAEALPGAGRAPDWSRVAPAGPDPEVEARAHLYAAVVNSRSNQPEAVIANDCERAAASPPIAEAMAALVECMAREAPNYLCEPFLRVHQRLYRSPADAYGLSMLTLLPFNARLTRAMAAALGPEVEQRIDALVSREHGLPARGKIDLLQYTREVRYRSDGVSFLQAHARRSSFSLFCSERAPVTLVFTARAPSGLGGVAATLSVNGREIGSVAVSGDAWATERLAVPRDALLEGENLIEVRWPPLDVRGEDAIARAARQIELWNGWEARSEFDARAFGVARDLIAVIPVFGQLQTFSASV